MNPCKDYCMVRFNHTYDPDKCDDNCDYAKEVIRCKKLESKYTNLKKKYNKLQRSNNYSIEE